MTTNFQQIKADILWLAQVIEERIKDNDFNFDTLKPREQKISSIYSDFISNNCISHAERLLLILTLVPHIYPVFLHDSFNRKYLQWQEFQSYFAKCPAHHSAIVKSSSSGSFLPTGQTFLYLIAGSDIEKRMYYTKQIFENGFYTISNNVISPIQNNIFDPLLSNIISLNHNYALAFITNNIELIKTYKQ